MSVQVGTVHPLDHWPWIPFGTRLQIPLMGLPGFRGIGFRIPLRGLSGVRVTPELVVPALTFLLALGVVLRGSHFVP